MSLSALAIGAVPAALATHDDPTAARAPAQAAVAKTAKASPARSRAAGATRVAAGRTTPALVAAAPVRATRTVGTTATASRTTAVVVSTTTSRPGGARTLAALEAPAGTAPASGRQPQRSGQGHPTHRRPDAAADATAADGAATPRHPGGNGRRDRHRADHPPATTTTTEAEAVATGPVARSGRHAHANAAGVRPGRPHASTAPADPAPADQVPTDPAPTEPGAS